MPPRLIFRFIVSLFLISGLSACSWFQSKDNSEPPAPLPEIRIELNVFAEWSVQTGIKLTETDLDLHPSVFEKRIYLSSAKGDVHALDLDSGATLWKIETKLPISSAVGVNKDILLVGTEQGKVLALNPNDGSELWRSQVSSEILSAPQADDNIVVVRSVDGRLSGLSRATGKSLWIYERNPPVLSLRGTSAPLISQGLVFAGFDNGRVAALEIKTGKPVWEVRISQSLGRSSLERIADIDSPLFLFENTLYATSFQGRTVALNPATGTTLWTRKTSSYQGMGIDNNALYLSNVKSQVLALDRQNGATLWKQDKLHGRHITAPLRVGNAIVVGDFEGYLHWFSPENGQFVARVRADESPIRIAPIPVTDNMALILSDSGLLTKVSVPNGNAEE